MIDFAPWDQMLQTYVKDGQVDYSRWQKESMPALEEWLSKMQAVSLDTLNENEGIAFLINLYNALTIQQVLQKYPIDTIRPNVLGIPNWSKFLRFFKTPIYSLGGQKLSLDNIEHDTLRARYSESRIHFALVCASESCPNLRSNAYQPDQLDTQLQEDAERFINNPKKLRYDAAARTLYCSKIFKWYEEDFVAKAESVTEYIQTYLKADLPKEIKVEYLPYSWQLNDQRISS
ncbi:MAG: DUF547 domain-containing protein [Cyanobacteria bacterium J06650_10]